MAREDVRTALEAMLADEATRERLAAGDFEPAELEALTGDEQLIVQDAAGDMPDVSGFALGFDGIKGESTDKDHKGEIEILSYSWGVSNLRWQAALKYSKI